MRNGAAKFCLLVVCLLFVSSVGAAQLDSKDELPSGVVIEKIVCQNDAAQSYALYLPTAYTPEKKWAVLYAFDPFGNGKSPVEIFRDAAEQYGFIVIGSNNSRNNLGFEKLSEIIRAFWADSHRRFSIDERRAYAAGLSGGARVANYFAASCRGCVAGVIACGATFTPNFPLDKSLPFSIFGTAGANDFNYPELVKTFEKINAVGIPNRLDIFDGTHQWLPKELTFDALRWMNLQAMKSGRMERDEKFIAESFEKQTNRAQTVLASGDVLQAARIYENIVRDFTDFADVKTAAEKLAEIRREKSYKKSLDDERNSFDEQIRTTRSIISLGADLLDAPTKNAALKKASNEIEGWRRKSKAEQDSSERRLARRVLNQIFAETYEAALYVNERQRDYKTMIANLELTNLVSPKGLNAAFELARAFALDGQRKNAVDALDRAVQNGFADCARINGKDEWKDLRGDERFQKIVEQIKCSTEKT